MDFRDYAHTETSAFVDRLIAAAEASAQQVRASADEDLGKCRQEIDELRSEANGLRAAADGFRAEAEGLRHDGDVLRKDADALREEAVTAREETERLREESENLRQQLATLVTDGAALRTEIGTLRAEGDSLRTQLEAEQSRAAAALEAAAAERTQSEETHGEAIGQLRAQLEHAVSEAQKAGALAQALEERVHTADATEAWLRKQVEDANALTDAVQEGMALMRARSVEVTAMLDGAVHSLDSLGSAGTVAEVFNALVHELAAHFPRVAIFRRKGNYLEGEQGAGVDITKLVIPTSLDSVLTRAATGGPLERVTAEQIAGSHSPFAGSPASALAAPLVFQGETLAVVYADTDETDSDAHAAYAGILVAHANILLSRLTQELKTARELREYAQMLLHEAEQMFLADIDEGRTESDRLRRLHDTIEFGRQLYAQRAALEGGATAGLLEDEITALVRAEPVTRFGAALDAALAEVAQRTAS